MGDDESAMTGGRGGVVVPAISLRCLFELLGEDASEMMDEEEEDDDDDGDGDGDGDMARG